MITEGFRVVLLAVCLAVAASSFSDNAELPICERSAGYLVMGDLHHCTTDPVPSVKAIVGEQGNFTAAEIAPFAQDYCTVAIPNGLSCFQDKIRECNATLQAKVSQLAERGVGLLCQPGGAGVNPAFSAVLDGIDDEELRLLRTNNGRCPGTKRSISRCRRRLPGLREPAMIYLDGLVSWVQGAGSAYVRCSFRAHRAVEGTCPYWKAAFLRDVRFFTNRVFLGVHLPDDLARELQMLTEAGSNHV